MVRRQWVKTPSFLNPRGFGDFEERVRQTVVNTALIRSGEIRSVLQE